MSDEATTYRTKRSLADCPACGLAHFPPGDAGPGEICPLCRVAWLADLDDLLAEWRAAD